MRRYYSGLYSCMHKNYTLQSFVLNVYVIIYCHELFSHIASSITKMWTNPKRYMRSNYSLTFVISQYFMIVIQM